MYGVALCLSQRETSSAERRREPSGRRLPLQCRCRCQFAHRSCSMSASAFMTRSKRRSNPSVSPSVHSSLANRTLNLPLKTSLHPPFFMPAFHQCGAPSDAARLIDAIVLLESVAMQHGAAGQVPACRKRQCARCVSVRRTGPIRTRTPVRKPLQHASIS